MNLAQAHGISEQLDRLAIVNDQNPPATQDLSALHNRFRIHRLLDSDPVNDLVCLNQSLLRRLDPEDIQAA